MLALHVTSKGSPEEKLAWAFRMYDVDENGSIEFNEMKRYQSMHLNVDTILPTDIEWLVLSTRC